MPALVVCRKRWLVGTDDFALPALVAIFIRLVCLGCTIGVIIYLFFGPRECLDENFQPEDVPPLLYGSLFAFSLILCMSIFNENIIFSISIRGNIPDVKGKRKGVIFWLGVRSVLIIIELLVSILCTGAVFGPAPYAAGALVCPEYHDGPLLFARVIVVAMLVTEVLYIVGFIVIMDPLGMFCSPSVLPNWDTIDDDVKKMPEELRNWGNEYAANSNLGRLHSNHIGYRDVLKKVKGLFCCLSANGHRSRQTAMQEMALALHTLFTNEDVVPSDLVAGLVLVSRIQKKEMKKCEAACGDKVFRCPCRIKGLRKITFDNMPSDHLPEGFSTTNLPEPVPFDPSDVKEQLLLDDLIHYMKYSMGIYGWMLHVFDNPCCGICQLLSLTCFRCRFRRWHPLARTDPELEHPRIVKDDCCMSGLATLRLHTDLEEQHIVYISYENEVFQAPFSISVDDKMETVVLTVRGTLSIRDAMTDLSVSMVEVEEKYKNPHVEGKQYMHKGMYITAKHIYDKLATKKLLSHAFSKNSNYRLILTGHSLGAGVASILSVMLEPYYPDLYCYAFSPPGCIFSFPIAHYSERFIQVVVLGNDMIPRTTFRSLFYLKRQMKWLINTCKYSKFHVLFRPRIFDKLYLWIRNCLFGDRADLIYDFKEIYKEIGDRLKMEATTFDGAVESVVRAKRALKKWKRRSRQVEGTLHGFVAGVQEGSLVASFPPRNVLHIPVKYSKMPWLLHCCFPDRLIMNHMKSEDICVIAVDRGMVDDHLPNNVLSGLLRCQKELVGSQYKPREVRNLRMEKRKEISEDIAQRRSLPNFSVQETSMSHSSPNLNGRAKNSDVMNHDSRGLHSSNSSEAVADYPVIVVQDNNQEQKIQKRKWPNMSQKHEVVEIEVH